MVLTANGVVLAKEFSQFTLHIYTKGDIEVGIFLTRYRPIKRIRRRLRLFVRVFVRQFSSQFQGTSGICCGECLTMVSPRVILPTLVGILGLLVRPTLGQSLVHTAVLDADGKFHVSWDFTDTEITFEVTVKTRGYFGLGFSPNGGMTGSDIVIGWVEDITGQGHLSDRHAVGNSRPIVDKKMDYIHQMSFQNETQTTIRFSRPLHLCGEEDYPITEETMRMIWAYNDNDPGADGEPSYHGTNRGTKSIFLLNPQKSVPVLPDDVIQHEFLNPSYPIPADEHTTYWCQAFAVPQLSTKHHVIKIDPIITPGLEAEVHHILLYGCYHDTNSSLPGFGHECYHPNMPDDFEGCLAVMYAWAIGGESFYLPEDAGLPFGYDKDPTMILMETHFDNPQFKSGLIDSSGLRFTMTPTLRPHDAGVLEAGLRVGTNQVIPPFSESFQTDGHCFPECLSAGMANNQDELKLFAYVLHSHLAGHAVKVRHFRDGVEQPLIAADTNYDFNLQETRVLNESATIKPNDHFIVECSYDTSDRTTVTWGGLSTNREMCLGFLFYYPKIPLSNCQSSISYTSLGSIVGVTAGLDGNITAPPEHAGKHVRKVINNDIDWTNNKTRKEFERRYNEEGVNGHFPVCFYGLTFYPVMWTPIPLPKKILEIPHGVVCGCVTFRSSTFIVVSAFTLWVISTQFRA